MTPRRHDTIQVPESISYPETRHPTYIINDRNEALKTSCLLLLVQVNDFNYNKVSMLLPNRKGVDKTYEFQIDKMRLRPHPIRSTDKQRSCHHGSTMMMYTTTSASD